jgi:suppressor of cytokine signaling 7
MLPDCDQDATSLPSPEDRPTTAEEEEQEEEEEFGEEPSMDFVSSIEKVKDYGWYWGPISGEAAEKILSNEPDGSFIVRDSSDDHYIFSLTFKLNGCIRHVRIEHDQGNFSLGSCTKFKSHTIVDFIEKAVEHSRSGRYLFFLHRRPVLRPMRVQLLHPVSRFKQVQSLRHMCRFVILKLVRRDLIPALPLPRRVIDYLSTPHYYSEQLVVEDDLAPSPEDVDMLSFVPQGLS